MSTFIYALADPTTGEIRYIGKTERKPSYRRAEHVRKARATDHNSHLLNWLRLLIDDGVVPDVSILEEVPDDGDWQGRERYWIAYGREQGWPLTNQTAGGEGLIDPSPEIRAQRSQRMKGNRYAIGNRNAAGPRSDEFRARMAEVAKETRNAQGHVVSDEARQRISDNLKDYFRNGGQAPHGEEHGQSKLTQEQVAEIRIEYDQGQASLRALGRRYGVAPETIRKIVNHLAWTHVD